MTQVDDSDFEVGDLEEALHSEPLTPANAGNINLEFTDAELLAASELKKYTPASRHLAIFLRTTGANRGEYTADRTEWSTVMEAKYSAVIQTLPAHRVENIPLGRIIPADVDFLVTQEISKIRASLLAPKTEAVIIVTDATIIPITLVQQGVVVEQAEQGKALIKVPGAAPLTVSLGGDDRSRVISGGMAFSVWYNTLYPQKLSYTDIPVLCRRLAGIMVACETPLVPEPGAVSFKARNYPPPSSLMLVPPLPKIVVSNLANLRSLVKTGYAALVTRPGVRDARTFFELCITAGASKMSSRDKLELISNAYLSWVQASVGKVNSDYEAVTIATVHKNVPPPYTSAPLPTQGKILEFVNKHRAIYRNQIDTVRKHDAPGLASVGDGHTSVPAKFQPMYSHLLAAQLDPDVPDSPPLEIIAIGTHRSNHWGKEMMLTFPRAKITWCDIDPAFRPKHLGNNDTSFRVFDILSAEDTPDGWAKGRVVFDDTMPERKVGNRGLYAIAKKVAALVRSGATAIISKLYYGSDEFSVDAPGVTPSAIVKLRDVYSTVRFFPGSSPHSPEYFVVAYNLRHVWGPVRPASEGLPKMVTCGVNDPGMLEVGLQYDRDLWDRYARSWHLVKGVDLIRANASQTIQASVGLTVVAYMPLLRQLAPAKVIPNALLSGMSIPVAATNTADNVADYVF